METPLRFGILGTGNIAHQFADGVAHARHKAENGIPPDRKTKYSELAVLCL